MSGGKASGGTGQLIGAAPHAVAGGADSLSTSSPAGARLAEMPEFYLFIQDGMLELLERWEKVRAARHGG